ncbi:MAG: Alpha/beta hydrolase family protein [Lentisphaerae bacterium ADurb.Bin242]|nr:MAG: Alpha/beta hydrolase family protein [Lentisphaerae bacterium ADurb.Bin242]
MKKYIVLFLLVLSCLPGSLSAYEVSNWEKMIRMFTKGDPGDLARVATQTLAKVLDEKRFAAAVADSRLRYGKFLQLEGPPEFVRQNEMTRVTQRARYEYASLLFTCFVEQKSGLVAGFFYKSLPPEPVENETFREEEVSLGGEWPLPGILLIPKNAKQPYPCVILVHGSGPQDRNAAVGPNRIFEEIAHALGKEGIASLRYDKRTKIYSRKVRKQTVFTLDDETVDDAVEALGKAASDPRLRNAPLFLLGHSLGGMLIPRIAQRTSLPAGYIFLAVPARKMAELYRAQTRYLLANNPGLTEARKKELAAELEEMLSTGEKTGRLFGQPVQKSYWNDLFGYDPVNFIGNVKCPMLFLQGGRDYQVTADDFNLWKNALKNNPKATFILYDDLNHLMQKGREKSMPEEYLRKEPVSGKATGDIAAFIRKNSLRKTGPLPAEPSP